MSETLRVALERAIDAMEVLRVGLALRAPDAIAISHEGVLRHAIREARAALATPPVPAGDEREALAALLEREFAAMGWPNVNTTNSDFIADRLLRAGVRLTEGGNNPASEIGYEDERTMGTGS